MLTFDKQCDTIKVNKGQVFVERGEKRVDINAIGQLIGTLGFPIVCCGALFWLMNKNEQARREDNAKQEQARREDNRQMNEAVNNNTVALTMVVTKVGGED